MNIPSLRTCKTPRALQKYLAGMARAITKIDSFLPGELTVRAVGDAVLVLEEDGIKYPGEIVAAYPDEDFNVATTYDVDYPPKMVRKAGPGPTTPAISAKTRIEFI